MRSLYLDDIPGAKPTKRVYDKSLKRHKLKEQIYRFAKNPQKQVIDWHVLERNTKQPLQKLDNQGRWRTKKSLDNSLTQLTKNLSQSSCLQRALSNRNFDLKDENKSSVLTKSARNSLQKSSIYDQPYFPHRVIDKKMGEHNKWSGRRGWEDQQKTQALKLPSIKAEYISKWN